MAKREYYLTLGGGGGRGRDVIKLRILQGKAYPGLSSSKCNHMHPYQREGD